MMTQLCKPGTKRLLSDDAPIKSAPGIDDQEAWYQATLARSKKYQALIGRRTGITPPVIPIGEARRQMDNLKRWLDNKDGYADPDPFGPAIFRW